MPIKNNTHDMHKHFWLAATTLLAIVSLFLLARIKTELQGPIVQSSTISVSGEGSILVRPDVAKISVGVTKTNVDFVVAQKEATDVINKTIDFLKSKNIEEKDIKTTSYNIYPQYDYIKSEQKFRGYEVYQQLEVKIRDLDNVGDVLAGVAGSGANMIGSLRLGVDDPQKVKEVARAKAIDEAKAKAQVLSRQLGVRLKKIVSFSESGGFEPPIYFAREMAIGMGGDFTPSPSIPAGENEIKVNVSITYEIR